MYKIIKGLSKMKLTINLRCAFGPKGEGLVEELHTEVRFASFQSVGFNTKPT